MASSCNVLQLRLETRFSSAICRVLIVGAGMAEQKFIEMRGAREHNLKSIDVDIPRDQLVVITGLSGSGKSSLAFDTIYAEGQRRYVESLSAYARQFLDMMEKPDVDHISGLSPAISIEQKTTSKNPRSTVGTVTEIYDYLRLLFARVGTPYSPATGLPIEAQQVQPHGRHASWRCRRARAPTCWRRSCATARASTARNSLDLRKQGFQRVKVERRSSTIWRRRRSSTRSTATTSTWWSTGSSCARGWRRGWPTVSAPRSTLPTGSRSWRRRRPEGEAPERITFSEKFACPVSGFTIPEIEPRLFSFNAPFGACPACDGLGVELFFDERLMVPDERLTLMRGAIAPWAKGKSPYFTQTIEALARHYGFDKRQGAGTTCRKRCRSCSSTGRASEEITLPLRRGRAGLRDQPALRGGDPQHGAALPRDRQRLVREEMERYQNNRPCGTCGGYRLKPEALAVKIAGLHVGEVVRMSIREALAWVEAVPAALTAQKNEIARAILKEIRERLGFLVNVGLDYLTLARNAGTLSGGESQRIRLASQIGSGLTGVLYVLDEPSIGLHQRDNDRLLTTLKNLRDQGNTVLVVEHDEEAIREADYVIDIGPGAGVHGGQIVAEGTPARDRRRPGVAHRAVSDRRARDRGAAARRAGQRQEAARGAAPPATTCKDVTAEFPLGNFTCVTGVSGGGKSTLTIETLFKTASMRLNGARADAGALRDDRGARASRQGHRHRPAPIGRTPRSNPATYTGAFGPIRDWFAGLPESQGARLQAGAVSASTSRAGAARPARATASSRSRCTSCPTSTSPARPARASATTARRWRCCSRARASPTCST